MNLKKSLLMILMLSLFACATQPKPSIPVTLIAGEVLDFTGKGGAAGIMIDSVMGGAGIAIGIAIDKGIAKDIAKNLDLHKPAFNIVAAFDQHLKNAVKKTSTRDLQNAQVTIERYGFKTFSGGHDAVSAWLEISVKIMKK